mmetsp:Transcript_9467/g.38357  ORF Transcript_9467/g.38357 Transcript_9467/m.38357 type:complete len:201 (-) Transcript_9467:25-627(-)
MVHLAAQRVTPPELSRERRSGGSRDSLPLQSRRDVGLHRLPRRAERVLHPLEPPQKVEDPEVLPHGLLGEHGGQRIVHHVLQRKNVPPLLLGSGVRHHAHAEPVEDVGGVELRVGRAYRRLQRPGELVRAHRGRRFREIRAHEVHEVVMKIALAQQQVPLHRVAVLRELVPVEQHASERPVDPPLRLGHQRVQRGGVPVG